MQEKLRAWWFHKQGLDGSLIGNTPKQVLCRSGWSRSVGGSCPYLTLFARGGIGRSEADAAAANIDIQELPSARGCTHVIPQPDYALALTVAQGFSSDTEIATAKKYLGVTDDEIEQLSAAIRKALRDAPLDPLALKKALGPSVRSLGPEGKKRGTSSTLPLALGRMQTVGEIRRIPSNGRLDQQKYLYAAWNDNPLTRSTLTKEKGMLALAHAYFRWIGPATRANFQWFSGLGVAAAKQALDPLGLISISPESDLLILPDEYQAFHDFTVPTTTQYALVSSLDSILLLRRDIRSLMSPEDASLRLNGDKGMMEIGSLADLTSNAILDRGRIIRFVGIRSGARRDRMRSFWSSFPCLA